ncbi:MAG: efflux RND transporter periplasmic adaptor subunit [Paracoccaceae bacterium]
MEEDQTKPPRRWPWITLAILILLAVVMLLWEVEDTANVTERSTRPSAPTVSVVTVNRAEARAQVSVFAELRPRWDTEIRAAVSGRITAVHDAALAGSRVDEGTVFMEIQRTQHEMTVATAELAVEEARLTLLRAQNQTTVARRQFDRDGVEAPNDLALYVPQLRIAERGLTSAQTQLAAAKRQLADTEVRAPYSGFVTRRLASLGQTVSTGEPLLRLSDDSRFEMEVSLSPQNWALLEHPIAGGTAQLFHRDGRALGHAKIRHGGGFLDPETRQMRVYLEVTDPGEAVLSGDFLRVTFAGRPIANTLTLPESALTRAGFIWVVDSDNLLQRLEPEILFRAGDTITIAAPEGDGPLQIVKTPLAAFLPAQRVTPQVAED